MIPKLKFIQFLLLCIVSYQGITQDQYPSIHYYLPKIEYDQSIPTPEKYFGFQVGEWHLSHDKVVAYLQALDMLSDRMELIEIGKTHEHRSLMIAMISSPKNLKDKEKIKKYNEELTLGKADVDLKMPLVLSQGFTIHGNEASGMHASVLAAYYLVAGKSKEVEKTLDNLFILMDPCLNPDGTQRFSTWVNTHKSKNLVSDPQSREFSETWPGGRYNHYWSDMNRDWLFLVHPESKARIRLLKEWNPSVLGDHHEMGTNNTFFFHPGVPSQNNPNTPPQNYELTEEIAKFHARGFDAIGSLYYTKYNFDDYYYGKGSTYSDAIGAIGILFEQASSRGHAQESDRGILTFPFTIKNQLTTALSTYAGMISLKEKLMNYKKDFLTGVYNSNENLKTKGYIFTSSDQSIINRFLDILLAHGIEVYAIEKDEMVDNVLFEKMNSYIVPLKQKKPILAKTIFEEVTSFKDSLFYDISGWTVPRAFGLKTKELPDLNIQSSEQILSVPDVPIESEKFDENTFAYILKSNQLPFAAAAYTLQEKGLKLFVSHIDIPYQDDKYENTFPKGSIVLPVKMQSISHEKLWQTIQELTAKLGVMIIAVKSGNTTSSAALGHPLIIPFVKPVPAFMVGQGISPQSAGEVWFHFDKELHIPATLLDMSSFGSVELEKYNSLVLPSGNYSKLTDSETSKIKDWVKKGNTLIALGTSVQFLNSQKMISLKQRLSKNKNKPTGRYSEYARDNNSVSIRGTIFSIDIDTGHPLFFGFDEEVTQVLRADTTFYEPTTNPYACPAKYSKDYLVSGYHASSFAGTIPGAAAITVHNLGKGKIICFQDNVLFRNYWMVGAKMFNNALFFGNTIDTRTGEKAD